MISIPDYSVEQELIGKGYKKIVGIDEVGRGSCAASVVAVAVHMPIEVMPDFIGRVKDSKKLSEKLRESLYDEITDKCECYVGQASNTTIDEINILQATRLAMVRAIPPNKNIDYLIIDGNITLDIDIDQHYIIKGDGKSMSIAAASIVAKVWRDRMMKEYSKKYPFSFDRHKGYLTKLHIEELKLHGPTDIHRLTFNKVK